jgi:hypothetical protein
MMEPTPNAVNAAPYAPEPPSRSLASIGAARKAGATENVMTNVAMPIDAATQGRSQTAPRPCLKSRTARRTCPSR